jgi:predicted membrane metal-binding protein
MAIFLLIVLSIFNWFFFLPINEAEFALQFQNICKKVSPQLSEFSSLYMATVCGVNPPPSKIIWDFRNSGLYHLIVVSGAHLIFCSLILDKLLWFRAGALKTSLKFIFLFAYSLFSGLNPPVVRALVGLVLFSGSERLKLNWSPTVGTLFSGFVCLALFPAWWGSLSFMMSWSAAFALSTASGPFLKCVVVYIIMLIPMSSLGLNSPLTIVSNWLLAPVLGFIILPASFLPYIHTSFLVFSDWAWQTLISIIHYLSQFNTMAAETYRLPIEMMWVILFGIQFAHYKIITIKLKREI